MLDYSFFAMLFYVASSLAPTAGQELVLENANHAEQRIVWTKGDAGRWAMTLNGRDVGEFERVGSTIVHHTGQEGGPRRFPIADLAAPVARDAARVVLAGQFAPRTIAVERAQGPPRLSDASRQVLRSPLLLRAR